MTWAVSYRQKPGVTGQKDWLVEGHPSREDALTFADAVLREGGEVASIIEQLVDGTLGARLDEQDVLHELET
jgi:hypothetical protein